MALSLTLVIFFTGRGAAMFDLSLGRLAFEWMVSVYVSCEINGD